jgi:hypothetical protein
VCGCTTTNSKQAQKRLDLTVYFPLLRLLANRWWQDMISKSEKIIFVTLIFFVSCKDSKTLPANIENRIFGQWRVDPNYFSKTFKIYKLDMNCHNKCNVFRFDSLSKEFYWYYRDTTDKPQIGCGNSLEPSYQSVWTFEDNSIILDKVWTSVQEYKKQRIKYKIFEFSPDTFTLIIQDTLINEYKNSY